MKSLILLRNTAFLLGAVAIALGLLVLAPPVAPPSAAAQTAGGGPLKSAPAAPAGCGPGPWVGRAALPYRAGMVSAASDGTYVYANGGFDNSTSTYHNETNRYDPVADTWTALAPSPDAHVDAPAVFAGNGKIYSLGGFTGQFTVTRMVRIYDIAANTWTTGAPLPTALARMGAGYAGGKIYVAGGTDGATPQQETLAYDIAANSWTTLANLPQAVEYPGFGLINGQLYLAGGNAPGGAVLNTLYAYNPAGNSWQQLANLPQAVAAPGSAAVNGQLWVFGGGSARTLVYDPATNAWSTGPAMNYPRSYLYGALAGAYVVAPGGGDLNVTESAAGDIGCSPTPTPYPTIPPGPPPPPGPVVAAPGDQQAPRVSQHRLVFEDNSTGDWDILSLDLSTAGATPVPVYRGPGDQRAPAISGDLVVWQDNRNGTWDIYGRHLNGGAEFTIATGPGDQTHPRVQGTLVTWENTLTPGHTSIVAEDLLNGQPTTLSDAATTNLNPDVDTGLVVWQSTVPTLTLGLPAAAGWQIVGYDLTTGLTSTLSTGPDDHTNPAVFGGTVVWVTTLAAAHAAPAAPQDSSIDGVDLRGGGRAPIHVTAPVAGVHTGEPRIRGRQVTFIDELTSDQTSAAVELANLDTHAVTVASSRGHDARNPDIDDGGGLIWRQQGSGGDSDIYGTGFPGTGCQPPPFTDVPAGAYFYTPVGWLTCIGAISGYGDATFRPYANTTRGQLAKIVVGAEGWAITTAGGPHFSDVPVSNPFYPFIETAYSRGIISGYSDGTFRWEADVTRGQLSKVVVGAQGWAINTTGGPHFGDVSPGDPFYPFVETAYNRGVISGYADGTFRVGAQAIRGQITKIVYIAVTSP